MEVVALCGIAALTSCCVSGLLCSITEAERSVAATWSGLGMREMARYLVEAVGAAVIDAEIAPARTRDALLAELRRLAIKGGQPFLRLSDAEALGTVVLGSALLAAVLGVVSWSWLGVATGLVLPAAVLVVRSGSHARSTEAKVAEAMPEAFGALAITLESGLSLPQAMRYVGAHSEEPIRSRFMRASFAMSCGVSATDALDDMVSGFSAPGLELVSLALKISQRTGSPLKDLLAEASQLAAERIELARLLDVKTSQARMSAQLVAGMPVAMVAFLSLVSSDFRSGLATTVGMVCVGIALGLDALAWLIIKKIMKVEL